MLADHENFEDLVRDNWGTHSSQNKLRDIWVKCHKLKGPLKKLNTQWFLKTTKRVEGIKKQLHCIQHPMSQNRTNVELIQEESWLLAELEKWSGIEEQIWKQKARIDWVKLGDSNTKFFHAYIKVRQNNNAITLLPKCENISTIKEFRPIACCTVLYKIISKVLANKMKMVLETVISESQYAFVQGRLIFDNIILSHEFD